MIKVKRDKWNAWLLQLTSGDGEEHKGCKLFVKVPTVWITIPMPTLIKPEAKKVYANWDAATIARLERNWYWDYTERQYGFCLSDGHLSIHYGRNSHDSRVDQQWSCFIPWLNFRFVRYSVYDLQGNHLRTWLEKGRKPGTSTFDERWEYKKTIPTITFAFNDFDGESIKATTFIEEREWRLGTRWCKWLSLFRKPIIKRSLDIAFSAETGKRKGSWKGGTIGHSITMLPGELHESAFRRYCDEHDMAFIGVTTPAEALQIAANAVKAAEMLATESEGGHE